MKRFINTCKAVTLIELLTVIGIIGIIASISAGFIKAYQPNIKLYTESRALRDALSAARSKSVAEQKTYGIHFGQTQYELILEDGTVQTQETYLLPSGISFASVGPFAGDMVTFNKAGAPSENGTAVLQTQDSDTRTITINPSGYVHTD